MSVCESFLHDHRSLCSEVRGGSGEGAMGSAESRRKQLSDGYKFILVFGAPLSACICLANSLAPSLPARASHLSLAHRVASVLTLPYLGLSFILI